MVPHPQKKKHEEQKVRDSRQLFTFQRLRRHRQSAGGRLQFYSKAHTNAGNYFQLYGKDLGVQHGPGGTAALSVSVRLLLDKVHQRNTRQTTRGLPSGKARAKPP